MILSHRWLSRHLASLPDPDTVVRGLEQLGIEVAGREVYGENLATIELVEVMGRSPHPDSDHLAIVDVQRGDGTVAHIVTGAANGSPGERLWYAPPGTRLPDGRVLETRALRGIASPGMLLSAEELGYQAAPGDLWIWDGSEPLGTTFLQAIGGLDTLYDLELTPNIAQYLQSVRRLAAELAAIWQMDVISQVGYFAYQDDLIAQVTAPDRCPLYGLVSLSIRPGAVSPLWMQTLLRAMGHRIIHPLVDVTNFVLWDLGEPLHAFDARRVQGRIQVRMAQAGETLTLLDGRVLSLSPDDLVIADENQALALAGIMGGVDSAIAPDTTEVLLECAHFSAPGIFTSSRSHNLLTDAAAHFGRGTDPRTVQEAPSLVVEVLQASGILQGVGPSALCGTLPPVRHIVFDGERVRQLLGVSWSNEEIKLALSRLGYDLNADQVGVPLYRHDVDSLYDLAEDVVKFYGLDRVPRTLPVALHHLAKRDSDVVWDEEVRDLIAAAGYDEVITRTFSNPAAERRWSQGDGSGWVALTNPLRDEESLMRGSLLASLLEVVKYNRARHDGLMRIFEVGRVFSRDGDQVREDRALGVVLSLDPLATWPEREQPSIYDLTGLLDFLSARLGWQVSREAMSEVPPFLHLGRAQRIVAQGQDIGYLGELRPRLASEYRVRRLGVLVMRFPAQAHRQLSRPGKPSRFPEVQRDLSVVVPVGRSYAQMRACLEEMRVPDLQSMRLIDRFTGEFGVSLTMRFTFQSESETLTDSGVDAAMGRIVTALGQIGVELRQ